MYHLWEFRLESPIEVTLVSYWKCILLEGLSSFFFDSDYGYENGCTWMHVSWFGGRISSISLQTVDDSITTSEHVDYLIHLLKASLCRYCTLQIMWFLGWRFTFPETNLVKSIHYFSKNWRCMHNITTIESPHALSQAMHYTTYWTCIISNVSYVWNYLSIVQACKGWKGAQRGKCLSEENADVDCCLMAENTTKSAQSGRKNMNANSLNTKIGPLQQESTLLEKCW